MRKLVTLSLVAVLALVIGCSKKSPMSSEVNSTPQAESISMGHRSNGMVEATYKVVIENITPNNGNVASQPFSPPVLAVHNPRFSIYQEGKQASYELAMLAEDAQSNGLLSVLGNSPFVHDYTMGSDVIMPGQSDEFMIEAAVGFRQLSLVGMLVNTNDGFVGADGIRLPKGGSAMYYLEAYDAGTEKNTELMSDIPGPCCGSPGVRVPENKRVRTHDGIEGVGDLDAATWGWDGPVAKITITLVSVNS
jgi:hypothetical protein